MRTRPPHAPRLEVPLRRGLILLVAVPALGLVAAAAGVRSAGAEAPLLTSDCPDGVAVCRVERGDASSSGNATASATREATAAPVEMARSVPLMLGNDDVGATRETLLEQAATERERREAAARAAAETDGSGAPSEAAAASRDGATEDEVWISVPEDGRVVATGGGAEAERLGGELELATCMERSIRAGNGFGESRRVCEAVFPPAASSGASDARGSPESASEPTRASPSDAMEAVDPPPAP